MRGTENESTLLAMKSLKNVGHYYDKDDHNDEDNDNCSNWFLSILSPTVAYAINVLIKLVLVLIGSYSNVVNHWDSNKDSHLKLYKHW